MLARTAELSGQGCNIKARYSTSQYFQGSMRQDSRPDDLDRLQFSDVMMLRKDGKVKDLIDG